MLVDDQEQAEQLGEHLRSWRLIWGLTQQLAASRAGISQTTLRRIEQGDAGVKAGSLLAVMRVMKLDKHFVDALDPMNHEIGRMRAGMLDRSRVRMKP